MKYLPSNNKSLDEINFDVNDLKNFISKLNNNKPTYFSPRI